MKCQRCGKREATESIVGIINGKKVNLKLCAECAKAISAENIPDYSSIYDTISSLTSGFFGSGFGTGFKEPEILKAVSHCPVCGMSYDSFASSGKLGCSECYKVFHDRMLRPLKQIHGTYEHVGKIPGRAGGKLKVSRRLDKLKMSLSEAVQKQEFERAAELRDEIKKLSEEE